MPRALGAILFCAAALFAQEPVPQTAAPAKPAAGLETPWDIAPVLLSIGEHSTRLSALLDRFDPNIWINQGASPTYAAQLQSCKEQAAAIAQNSKALARNPEQLAASVELLLRLHGLDTMLISLEEVVRKYQDPARAQDVVTLAAEGGGARDRFQQYLISLAADREHALEVMDKEAQRCRGMLATPPPAPPKTVKKK